MTSARRLFLVLVAIDAILIILHLVWGKQFDIFNLDGERNPAAYWSGAKLVAVAALAVGTGFLYRAKAERWPWLVFAFLFLMLAFDEISELHENITYYLIVYLPAAPIFRHPTYNWIIFLSPVIIASFVFLTLFVRQIRRERKQISYLLIGGLGLLLLAILSEFANGAKSIHVSPPLLVVIEEAAELMAANLFLVSVFLLGKEKFASLYQKRRTG